MKLLPENSYYQLIGFGSNYKVYNEKPEIKSEKNLEKTYHIINCLDGNLGETNLSGPLYYILKDSYTDYKDINLSKQIIVLTDGDINVGDDIIELIKLHNNEFRIHCIGIGDDVNKKLIVETTNAGNGKYCFISKELIDTKVFEILKECTKEYIKDYKFILNNNEYELQPVNKTTYNKESLNYCFTKKGNEIINDLNIEFNWKNLEENFKKNIKINSEKIIKLTEGDELSKLIIGLSLKYDIINDKNEQIKLSKLYQVLCQYTTLYAEIEGDKSIIDNKIKTIVKKYSIEKINNYRMKACIDFNEQFRFRSINSRERFRFSSMNKVYRFKEGEVSKKYYMKKKGDNIYLWALIILILVVIFYIVKRLYK